MCLRGASEVDRALLQERNIPGLSVHMVWSTQLGAEERHVPGAASLIASARVLQYWDPGNAVGTAFESRIPGLSFPAWDVWMLFAPGVVWEGDEPPEPTWWEHQLGVLDATFPQRRLDADRFARRAAALAVGAQASDSR